jgi:hypothetical protein
MTKPPPGPYPHKLAPDEIVPAALRIYLRWDHRHDEAKRVLKEQGAPNGAKRLAT